MKHLVIALLTLVFAGTSTTAVEGPPQKPREVHGQGCVEPGIELRCVIVKDLRNGRLYNLIIKGLQPAVGEGIEFVGTPHEGPTPCMQGIALEVTGWARLDSLKCPKGSANRK